MTMPSSNPTPTGDYHIGRMAEALSQNTATLAKLTEAVEENSRSTAQLATRQSLIEDKISHIQSEQRKALRLSITGHANEVDVSKRFEFIERLYRKDQESQSIINHSKKALAGAVVVAVLWWGWALIKDAAVGEVAATMERLQEFKGKETRQ